MSICVIIRPMKDIILAPLAGFTDRSLRALCLEYGASLVITEMVSAKALTFGDKKSLLLARPYDMPCDIQLFGSDPDVMAEGAKIVAELAPHGININMGCPVPKIVGNGEGSALMRSPKLIESITRATCSAGLPVSVKLRAGIDGNKNAAECAKAAEAGGAVSVTVHGRLREDMYNPNTMDIDIIAEVKRAVSIPVFANGDITNLAEMNNMLSKTGANGVMIGRAALGNPAIFRELLGGEVASVAERLEICRRQIAAMVEDKGERLAMRQARSQLCHYFKGFNGAATLRSQCVRLETFAQFEEMMGQIENII